MFFGAAFGGREGASVRCGAFRGSEFKACVPMKDVADEATQPSTAAVPSADPKPQRGIGGTIWSAMGLVGSLFSRGNKNDFEKRLQHLTKEEVAVHTRLKRRTQRWRKLARVMIIYSVVGEVGCSLVSNLFSLFMS